LHEIIRFPEVAETYIENTYNEAIEFAKIRDEHWNKANEIILKKAPELKKPLSKLYTDICSIYRKDVMDPKRIAYEISEAYRNFLEKYNLCEMKNAFEVIQNLKPFERYLYGYRKDIFNELENLSITMEKLLIM